LLGEEEAGSLVRARGLFCGGIELRFSDGLASGFSSIESREEKNNGMNE